MITAKTGGNGRSAVLEGLKRKLEKEAQGKTVDIPAIVLSEMNLILVGDRPLITNNKLNVAAELDARYSGPGGKGADVKPVAASTDEQYARAFYVLPDSKYAPPHPKGRYGVPASGIRKCACSAIRTTGITDNAIIGLITKSFWVLDDGGGLCLISFDKLEHDVRAVTPPGKKCPQLRHRPRFEGWRIKLRIRYNQKAIGPDQIVNLFMHAGQYIGLCELRAEKKQGMCGGFVVEPQRS